jgi:hypothetical protein
MVSNSSLTSVARPKRRDGIVCMVPRINILRIWQAANRWMKRDVRRDREEMTTNNLFESKVVLSVQIKRLQKPNL